MLLLLVLLLFLLLLLLLLLLLAPTVYVWLAYILWHGVHHILGGYTHREIERLRQGWAFITELLSWRKYGLTFIQIYPVITTLYSTRFSFSFMFVVVIVVVVVVYHIRKDTKKITTLPTSVTAPTLRTTIHQQSCLQHLVCVFHSCLKDIMLFIIGGVLEFDVVC